MSNWPVYDNISDFYHILSRSDVKSQMRRYKDPLHQAAAFGRDELLTQLLEAGAKVNAYCYHSKNRKWKSTALHWAAFYNKISCVKILIKNGADQNMHGERKI